MKFAFIFIVGLIAFAFSADLSKFSVSAYKSATVTSQTRIFSSVDAKTSETGKNLAWLKQGDALEVIAVYAPFIKLSAKAKGWAWVELLTLDGDKATCDKNTDGRLGVALLAEPNKYDVVNGALFAGETAAITDIWVQWVKVRKDGIVGYVYIADIELK